MQGRQAEHRRAGGRRAVGRPHGAGADRLGLTKRAQGKGQAAVEVGAAGGSATRDQLARTILQNALVLAVDQDVALPAAGGEEGAPPSTDDGAKSNAEASTVTLAVSPVHGEVLTVAETCGENFGGRLALALRGLGDSGLVGTRAVWSEDGAPPTCAAMLGLTSLQ